MCYHQPPSPALFPPACSLSSSLVTGDIGECFLGDQTFTSFIFFLLTSVCNSGYLSFLLYGLSPTNLKNWRNHSLTKSVFMFFTLLCHASCDTHLWWASFTKFHSFIDWPFVDSMTCLSGVVALDLGTCVCLTVLDDLLNDFYEKCCYMYLFCLSDHRTWYFVKSAQEFPFVMLWIWTTSFCFHEIWTGVKKGNRKEKGIIIRTNAALECSFIFGG